MASCAVWLQYAEEATLGTFWGNHELREHSLDHQPILQTVFIVIIGLGHYYTVRMTRIMVQDMRAENIAGAAGP